MTKLIKIIEQICQEQKIFFDKYAVDQFIEYKNQLKKWNTIHNIIRLANDEQLISRDFCDSIILKKIINKGEKVADIGSGAGIPGLILAIFERDIEVDLIESKRKKSNFLKEVKRVLNLDNVKIIDQYLNKNSKLDDYDTVISRAAMKFDKYLDVAKKLIKSDGKIIYYSNDLNPMNRKGAEKIISYQNRFIIVYKPKTNNPC